MHRKCHDLRTDSSIFVINQGAWLSASLQSRAVHFTQPLSKSAPLDLDRVFSWFSPVFHHRVPGTRKSRFLLVLAGNGRPSSIR